MHRVLVVPQALKLRTSALNPWSLLSEPSAMSLELRLIQDAEHVGPDGEGLYPSGCRQAPASAGFRVWLELGGVALRLSEDIQA